MQLKEFCEKTGVSKKTVRLYEEKGLITPARKTRNGREYREYTPELAAALQKIVTLRKAQFTMDEIRTMQTRPEEIPRILRDYQLWLRQQEETFHALRLAADRLPEEGVGSVDTLLRALETAAEPLPLPPMDIHPSFARLDRLEEGPRHVERQVNFDETVPDAKVFRQMNVALDQDRANNAALGLGQLEATARELHDESSGPVERALPTPQWVRVLGGILTAALALSLVLLVGCWFSPALGRHARIILAAAVVLLLLRLSLVFLPEILAHRRWLRMAQQSDSTDMGRYEAEALRRRTRRLRLGVGITLLGLLLVGGIAGLTHVLYLRSSPQVDYTPVFVTVAEVGSRDLQAMGEAMEPLAWDLDGNGTTVVRFRQVSVQYGQGQPVVDGVFYTQGSLRDYLSESTDTLFFITNVDYRGENVSRQLAFAQRFAALPEDLVGSPAGRDDACRVDVSGTAPFRAAGLEDLPVYACISKSADQQEYALAVELLRRLLDT